MRRRKIGATSWMESAACAEPELDQDALDDAFADEARQRKFALAFCKSCPVREECFQYSQNNRFIYGVFGGLTDQQRRRLMGIREKIA